MAAILVPNRGSVQTYNRHEFKATMRWSIFTGYYLRISWRSFNWREREFYYYPSLAAAEEGLQAVHEQIARLK